MVRAVMTSLGRAWHWQHGEIAPFQGGVSLSDRGFRYGQHLFESLAVRKGVPLLAAEHLALLVASAKEHHFPFPRGLSAALRRFLRSLSLAEGMLRIYLTAGVGAPASPIQHPGCYLTWEPIHFPTPEEIEKGLALTCLKKPFLGSEWGVKSGNYAAHLQALQSARAAGADEGIVCNGKGQILSCTMANLLVWMPSSSRKEILLTTPPSGESVRAGAVLEWVRGRTSVVERILRPSDLLRAVALAVTNSRLGVMPVTVLDGGQLPDPSLARALAADYLRQVVA
jgi:branched-subunit amino acid aminotransferase/4-amino-4-deoxychorismate lyase